MARLSRDRDDDLNETLRDLTRKIDDIPNKLENMRKEFQTGQQDLRRELFNTFVPKNEYDPKHTILIERTAKTEGAIERVANIMDNMERRLVVIESKITEYDRIVAESRTNTPTYYAMVGDVQGLKREIEEVKKRGEAIWTKVLGAAGVAIAITSLVITLVQHVSIHP